MTSNRGLNLPFCWDLQSFLGLLIAQCCSTGVSGGKMNLWINEYHNVGPLRQLGFGWLPFMIAQDNNQVLYACMQWNSSKGRDLIGQFIHRKMKNEPSWRKTKGFQERFIIWVPVGHRFVFISKSRLRLFFFSLLYFISNSTTHVFLPNPLGAAFLNTCTGSLTKKKKQCAKKK